MVPTHNAFLKTLLVLSYSKHFKLEYCLGGGLFSNCPKLTKMCIFLLILHVPPALLKYVKSHNFRQTAYKIMVRAVHLEN